ncbi:hypothetical protein RHSIM_Rhsim06G0221000 [Rhododendron simsii]|uniref:Uncharacterized protein n=1 Tax=Rhododendron simsii TaxID=118357 RepID=A0A834GYC0_RHOSS|nr:hypothetical protein RHSIM_Rhsim06G0221000 [Rhododendron simsii]
MHVMMIFYATHARMHFLPCHFQAMILAKSVVGEKFLVDQGEEKQAEKRSCAQNQTSWRLLHLPTINLKTYSEFLH